MTEANDELERRVQERTAELVEANRLLQAELAECKQAEQEIAALNEIGRALSATLDVSEVLKALLAAARDLTGADLALVALAKPETGEVTIYQAPVTGGGVSVDERPRLDPELARRVLAGRQPIIRSVASVRLGPPYPGGIDWDALGLKELLSVPLVAGGEMVGAVGALHREAGALGPVHVSLLQALAPLAAVAIQNARLYDAQKKQRELAETLRETGAALVATLDTDAVLDRLLECLERIVPHDAASVMLVEGDKIRIARWRGYEQGHTDLAHVQHSLTGAPRFGRILATGEPAVISDTWAEPDWPAVPAMAWFRSWAAIPIRAHGLDLGLLNVNDARPNAFSAEAVQRLAIFAGQVAFALHNARLYEQERAQYRRLEQSQAQLVQAEKLALMGRLAASFAHEINNPLQAVRSHLELSLDYPVSPEERAHYLQVARDELERLSEVTRRVLGFYRPAPEARRVVCLADLVERTMLLVDRHVQRAGIEVTLALTGEGQACASGDQMVQVFLNLIINAIEATGEGGRLTISERLEGEQVALDFANDGPRIPAEVMTRLFEPFFTTKSGGTGLGLSISRDLVEQFGGTLTAANLPAGAVFTVRLPAARGEGSQDAPRGAA